MPHHATSHNPNEPGIDAGPEPSRPMTYLCFGHADQRFLIRGLPARPGFDQVLAVRFIPGTVRSLVGHPLDDDVEAIRFDEAQPVTFGRDEAVEHRLVAGEVTTGAFALAVSPGHARGFTVGIEVQRQLYLGTEEPT